MSEKGASGLVARRFPFVCPSRDGKIAAEVKHLPKQREQEG